MDLASIPPTPALDDSARGLLLRLATYSTRRGGARWEHAIDDVARRVHELREHERFEDLCAPWLPRLTALVCTVEAGQLVEQDVRDLDAIVTAAACVLEHLDGHGRLDDALLRPSYRAVDAARMTREVGAAFRNLAVRRGVHFTIDLPDEAVVHVDPAKLELIVLTLLYNAFKHTPTRGSVHCALHLRPHDDLVTFSVVDTSPRIRASETDALFAAGVHDRATTFSLRGRLVDLGVARDCARLQGGWLALRASEKRRGCTFEAALPTSAPEGCRVAVVDDAAELTLTADTVVDQLRTELSPEPTTELTFARDRRPLALVVEDNPHTQRILAMTLQPAYAVATAANGEEGLAKAAELRPDVILTDVRMPVMDGEAMVHQLRAHAELAEVPILVLTASDDRAVMVRLLDAGVEDVLRKPFELAEVRARVRSLVAAKRARDTLNATIGHQEDNIDELADEVAEHQRGLQSALAQLAEERDHARRADRSKSNFLRMMSHELKTPLAALQLQLHGLERRHDAANGASNGASNGAGDDVPRMRRSIRRLTLLIDTMTEWVRIADGRFEAVPAPVVLGDVVAKALDVARIGSGAKRVAVTPPASALPPLYSDARLVALLVDNLVTFALQLSDRGSITIATAARGETQELRLTCCDARGAGEQFSDELFHAFNDDGDLGVRPGAGSGLGLRVVRDIARALGGELALAPATESACPVFVLTLRSTTPDQRFPSELPPAGGHHAKPATEGRAPR
ncbi:MAG: response regulator [Deltaproteobacteria bacterium]|nr:response regulator [Deltaproteobacteria bacterium]